MLTETLQEEDSTNKIKSSSSAKDPVFYQACSEKDHDKIDQVMEMYPARVTDFLQSLIEMSDAIKKQYIPSVEELESDGTPTPFEEGKEASSVYGLERVYRDRVLITPHFDCPAYCRFCYKKSRVMRKKRPMTYEEIDAALLELSKMKEVRGALITGGDPLMNPKKMFYLLDEITKLDNIFEIRIGTRHLLTRPEVFTDALCDKLASFNKPNYKHPEKSKYLAINVHFNHPDELAPEVVAAAHKLTSRGITLRNQTVLLKGINDDVDTIKNLFMLLIRNNIIPYYLNHCMPVESSDHLRSSVQKGLEIYKHLCTESATAIPHYVYAIFAGKVHVGPGSKLEYVQKGKARYIKTTTEYTAKEFREITKRDLPPNHVETKEGYIQGYYLDGSDS